MESLITYIEPGQASQPDLRQPRRDTRIGHGAQTMRTRSECRSRPAPRRSNFRRHRLSVERTTAGETEVWESELAGLPILAFEGLKRRSGIRQARPPWCPRVRSCTATAATAHRRNAASSRFLKDSNCQTPLGTPYFPSALLSPQRRGAALGGHGRLPRVPRPCVCGGACHSLAPLYLWIARQAEPTTAWRIISSDAHSTVWDGSGQIFDPILEAMGIEPTEAFRRAGGDAGGGLRGSVGVAAVGLVRNDWNEGPTFRTARGGEPPRARTGDGGSGGGGAAEDEA